ncbi:hypothetical protein TNCV_456831 [Trichonephila clavipes]|nr:hypothetical protein TNCV_456831 [Trichonephila clavipes]
MQIEFTGIVDDALRIADELFVALKLHERKLKLTPTDRPKASGSLRRVGVRVKASKPKKTIRLGIISARRHRSNP